MAEFFNDVDFQKASYADKMAYVADYAKSTLPPNSSQTDIDDYVKYMQDYTRKEYKWTPKDLEERRAYAISQANKKMATKPVKESPSFPTIKGKIDYTNPYAETATLSVRPNAKIKAITDYNKFEQERKKTQQDIKKYGSVLTQGKGYMGSGYKPEVQPPTLLESIKSGIENNSITGGILKAMTKQPEDIIQKQYPKELKESIAQRDRTKQVENFYREAKWEDVLQDPNWYAYAASSLAADLPLTMGTGLAGEKLIAKMSTSPEVINYINKLPASQRTGKALLNGIRKYAPKALVRGVEGAGYGTGFTALQSPEATSKEYAINAALGGLLGNIPTAIEGISGLSKLSKEIPNIENVENITKSITEADDFLNEDARRIYQDRLLKETPVTEITIKPVENIQNLEQSLLQSAKQAEESIKYKPDPELFNIKPLSEIKSELPKAYNIVNGDEIIFTEPVYGGSFKRPVYKGERINHVKIIDESYGADKGQHTFSFEVIRSEGKEPLEVGKSYRRKGRNIYNDANLVTEAEDKIALTADKNIRADEAKNNKYMNLFNEGKFDKIPPEELEKIKNGTLFDIKQEPKEYDILNEARNYKTIYDFIDSMIISTSKKKRSSILEKFLNTNTDNEYINIYRKANNEATRRLTEHLQKTGIIDEGLSIEMKRTALLVKNPPIPEKVYRGISLEELKFIHKNGYIKSSGVGNFSYENKESLTFYSSSPHSAQAYADGFAINGHGPTIDKPGYVLEIKSTADMKRNKVNYVETNNNVKSDNIVRVIEIRPTSNGGRVYQEFQSIKEALDNNNKFYQTKSHLIKTWNKANKENIRTYNTVDNFEVSKEFTDELNNYVKSMAGDNAEITINNNKMFYTNPDTNQSVELSGKAIGNLINISTKQSESEIWKTVDHETIHVIKNMGGITDDEIKSLADSGLLREIRDKFDIDNRYMEVLKSKFGDDYDSIENILNEEALAKAFSEQKYADNPIIRKVMQWIQQFRNYMQGKGFTSEQKLFNEIRSGKRANGKLSADKEYFDVRTPNEEIYNETGGNRNIIKDVTEFVTDKLNTSYDYIKNGRPLEQWFDKYRPLDNLTRKATPSERMVYYLFSNKQKAAITELETIINSGLKDIDGKEITRPVKEIIGQIPTKDMEDFKGYALSRLQSEVYAPKFENTRYIEIIKTGTPQELSDLRKYTKMYKDGNINSIPEKWLDILEEGNRNIGITTEKAVQAINNTTPEKKALYDSVLSEITDFNNKLVKKYLVDTGRISQETFDKWSSKPLYLHVERVMDGTKIGGRKTGAFKNIKGVETGTDNLKDIIDSQMLHWKRVISLGNEQEAWNTFIERMPNLFRKITGSEMAELGGKFASVKNETIANALTREGKAIVDVLDNDFIDEYSRLFYIDSNDFTNNKNIIKRYGIKDDGTWGATYYKVNDDIAKMYNYPFDGDALEGFLRWTDKEGGLGRRHYVMENMTNNAVEAMQKLHLDKPAKMVRMGAVTFDSAYSVFGNPVQDVLTAFINSDNPLAVPGSHLILGTLRKMGLLDKEARDLFYKTSVTGASFVENIGENNIKIKALYKFVEVLKALGAFMEDIPRLDEFSYLYRKGLKEGASEKDAIDRAVYGARKITAAFDQSGTIGGKFNNVTAFFNAQLQGIDSFSKTVRNHPLRTVARGAGMISTGALLYYKLMKDSDVYKNASLDSRLHNIFLPLPYTNAYLRIPMRREISALFWTPAMALYETMNGNKHALDEILPTIQNAYSPRFIPSAFAGFWDISRNRDYKGDKIITPMEEQFRKKEDIYNLNTSDTAIAFSKFYNMVAPEERELSPKEIDYWINSITGGAWKKTNINILKDSMISNTPLAGRYFVDEVDYSRPNSKIERMFTLNEELVKNINPKVKSIDDQIITMNKSGNIDANRYTELMSRKKVLLAEKVKLEKYTKPALKRYKEYTDIVKKDKLIERIRQGDLTAKDRLIELNKNLSQKLDIIGEGD